jgi:hypothetical protein
MELQQGMIGFSGGNKFIQKAIKFFISSEFSHSFVVIDGPYRILSVLETTDTRVCPTPIDRKLTEDNYVNIWDVLANEEIKKEAAEYVYDKFSGEMYGYLSYFWYMYRWFFRLFKIEKKKMWKWASGGITCSELTATYLDFLYHELFEGIDLNTVSPRELYKIVNDNKDKFVNLGWYKK